ncbi:MAG: NUDIX domain-containing protein [Helicobacteraceae bacterium]|jgi:UDP-sugar diphosphatase|nr:NUDIX domain-containing protein [Helicobacteraceae bacterium]
MIKDVQLLSLEKPRFVKPIKMVYNEDGKERIWEVVQASDSVAALIYNVDKDAFILVRQFRPPIYLRNNDGYTYEMCAGIIDKDKSIEEIMIEEISEETGYKVNVSQLRKITKFYSAVGFAGSAQMLFFTEVTDSQKTEKGGGVDMEKIDVIELPVKKMREFMYDESIVKTSGLLFAFMWFINVYKGEGGC